MADTRFGPGYKLTWRAREVQDQTSQATIAGMLETLEACVTAAKVEAPVRTGRLRDDITIIQPPHLTAHRVVAQWGNTPEVPYAPLQNYGTVRIPAKHYLEHAADQEYPKTAERIQRHMR